MKNIINIIILMVLGNLYSQSINDNLLLYYPFSGDTNDASGNGLHGVSNATLTNDRFGNANEAYSFNGVNEYINFPNDVSLKPDLPVSFSFWINFNDVSNEKSVIFTTDFAQNNHTGVWMNLSSGYLAINYGDNTGNTTGSNRRSKIGTTQLEVNRWYHIVGIVNGPTDMELYIDCENDNGTYQGSGGAVNYTSNPGSIGRKDGHSALPAYYFDGILDEFRYWNRELTESEIELLCEALPDCASVTSPSNSATDVSLNSSIEWNSVSNANGYRISIGTSAGASDVLDAVDVGDLNVYTHSNRWEENTDYFVRIDAYNSFGDAINCTESTFTTVINQNIPNCAEVTSPSNGSTNVSLNSSISWNLVSDADGYRISIGTSAGASDVLDEVDLGNVNVYNYLSKWNRSTNYFVRVDAYNSVGNAINCSEISFITTSQTTTNPITIPKFFSPNNDGVNDNWEVIDNDNAVEYIFIFDRYGKVLSKLIQGNLIWDGKYNGKRMENTDYWYVIQLKSREQLKGHFSLIGK
ncbi:T9SS type B sorting domain-containing protein [Aureibaculum conchae]|uniref:T9SS type B sorting domain-containing protein n=1 Tax=Aureibaculum sp. 2308TA14-22 TaxID=3108392 RepID=UPI003390E48A